MEEAEFAEGAPYPPVQGAEDDAGVDDEDMAGPRKGRRIDTRSVPSSFADAAAQLEDARRRNRERAARFGKNLLEPNVLGHSAAARRVHEPGLATGFSTTSADEEAKRRARAAAYGVPVFDYAQEPAKAAGLSEVELQLRQARRLRASKFGGVDELDVAVATAAHAALSGAPNVIPLPDEAPPLPRPEALHLRVFKYLPAATRDLREYFADFRPASIDWLNGVSVNVVFEDGFTAARALASLTEPIPRVPGVPEVPDCWRIALKPLVKRQTDRYAPSGSKTTLYMRVATDRDVKELADKSAGPRSQGTHSIDGAYALGKPEDLASPALVATVIGETLRQAARALELPVAFRASHGPDTVSADGAGEGEATADVSGVRSSKTGKSRVITVVLPAAPAEADSSGAERASAGHHDNRFAGSKRDRTSYVSDSAMQASMASEAAAQAGGFSPGCAGPGTKVKGRGHAKFRPRHSAGGANVAAVPDSMAATDASMGAATAAAPGNAFFVPSFSAQPSMTSGDAAILDSEFMD